MSLSVNQLKFFADYIEKELGIMYSDSNYFQLEQRLEKIAKQFELSSSVELYARCLKDGIFGDLKQFLLDIATNNETLFFRDPKVFQSIEKAVLPSLRENRPTGTLYRTWNCAASFGQEPYSTAMLVLEFLKNNPTHPRFEIWATDIADHALKRCKEGRYTQLEVQRGLSAPRLVTYFKKSSEEGFWDLSFDIKSMVQFKKHNLLDPFVGFGQFDLILCRYVLIYQDATRKKEIISRLEKCLTPGGFLVLGASESAIGCGESLEQVMLDGAVFYRKKK